MKKKPYKIVESEIFKKQKKKLPKEVLEKLEKVMEKISKNPMHVSGSMSVLGPPTAEELKQWMGKTKTETTDLVLEYLRDKNCLNKKGRTLAHKYYKKYVKEEV